MERFIAAGLTVATMLVIPAFLIAPLPAGACSLHCPGDQQFLEAPVVTFVSGDETATPPEFGEAGTIEVYPDGTPHFVRLGDQGIYLNAVQQ